MHDRHFPEVAPHSWRQWLGATPRGVHASSPWLRGFIVGGLICASLLLLGFHISRVPPVLVWVLVVGLFGLGCYLRRYTGFTGDAVWNGNGEYEALDVDEEAPSAMLPTGDSSDDQNAHLMSASPDQPPSIGSSKARPIGLEEARDLYQKSEQSTVLNSARNMRKPGRHHDLPSILRSHASPRIQHDRRDSREKALRQPSLEEGSALRAFSVDDVEKSKKTLDLPENVWSLNMVASVGQAHFAGGQYVLPVPVAFASTVVLGVTQALTVFLVVHDVNQDADPVTVKPSTPWLHKAWTVNTMKWTMILFLCVGLSNDASQCGQVMKAAFKVRATQLTVPRWTTVAIPIFQFLVLLGVVWGGVSVILSCQAVPDILYNSLAITFIVNADELFYDFIMRTMDLDPDLQITIENRRPDAEDRGSEGDDSEEEEEERDRWLDRVQKVMLIIPIVFGFSIAAQSCWTGKMPTKGLGLHEL